MIIICCRRLLSFSCKMANKNMNLIKVLRQKAKMYHPIRQKWQQIAFNTAADKIEKLDFKITSIQQITNIKGIGTRIQSVIVRYLEEQRDDRNRSSTSRSSTH